MAPTSKSNWKKSRVHEGITLPSGVAVDIQIPNLPALVRGGALPNDLLEVATKAAVSGEVPSDLLEKLDDYHKFLVAKTVVKPEVSEEEVNDLPTEDIEMLVGFATRARDTDAIGHHIAGLEKVAEFRQFRGLDDGVADILGA